MVFFNYATMQMAAKIVYYGPGLCGKTTNLHHIYGRTAPGSRGEMVSLETETDRTLFFDLLPLDVGVIGGFKTRVQLYTVPGQVFYNTTRKLVLKGVDGIVFVADSQNAMRDANVESMVNLRTNLAEIGVNLDDLPLVFQYNKRDLPNILSLQELEESLNPDRKYESYEACAVVGQGVFETLKAISKITLRSVKKKMLGQERTTRPAPLAGTTGSSIWPAAAEKAPADRDETPGSFAGEQPPPPSGEPEAAALPSMPEPAARPVAATEIPTPRAVAESPEIGEVTFSQTPAMEVKHVRVRSNIDILAELDKLRRNATSAPSQDRAVRRAAAEMSIDDLLANSLNHKKEINRVFEVRVPQAELARGHTMRVGMELKDDQNNPVGEKKSFSIPLNTNADVEKLLLSLKFHISTK
jgi:mutual gliding-motility protein MglA